MKINLAVYTAIHGYDWQPGTVYATSDLVRYKRGIGRLPDPLMEELPFGGVFNDGDTVVFYRYHMAIKSDAKGRDSLYLVLGTLPKSEVGKVDFRYLFALPEFAKPLKPAPTQAAYIGSAATGTVPDFSASFKRNGNVSLSEIGTWFSCLPDGNLAMRIAGTYADPVVNVQYERPYVEPQSPTIPVEGNPFSPLPTPNSSGGISGCGAGYRSMPPQPPVMPRQMAESLLLPILIAFLAGGIAGWYAKDAKDWIVDKVRVMRENKVPAATPPPPKPDSTPQIQPSDVGPGQPLQETPPSNTGKPAGQDVDKKKSTTPANAQAFRGLFKTVTVIGIRK